MLVRILPTVVAGLIFTTLSFQTICAQEISKNVISATCTLPIKGISESTNGVYNFKNFEVETPDDGSYYVNFWLLPAKYADDNYTSFYVYVNNVFAGTINPSFGNWQSAGMDSNDALDLQKGLNVISIATKAPESPDVETIKVAKNNTDVVFQSDAYNEYLDAAMAGNDNEIFEVDNEMTTLSTNSVNAAEIAFFTNVPLRYSFYKTFSFTENQEIFITSSSVTGHFIDVIYYAKSMSLPACPILPNSIIEPIILKPEELMDVEYASSEEMQGLNWKGISEKAVNSSIEIATVRLTIPKSGHYLIRLRSKTNEVLGVADLNVNGTYYYEDAPFYFYGVECEIPADGSEYASMTNCATAGEDDPIIFIHGNGVMADKIVGVNDDGPAAKLLQYNLSGRDSYISQKYFVKTHKISVSSYSSNKPVSTCDILARVSGESSQDVSQMRAVKPETKNISNVSIADSSVKVPGIIEISSSLEIIANESICNISVFNLSGKCVASINDVSGNTVMLPVSKFNMTERGMYIVSVETINGVSSKKVIVK